VVPVWHFFRAGSRVEAMQRIATTEIRATQHIRRSEPRHSRFTCASWNCARVNPEIIAWCYVNCGSQFSTVARTSSTSSVTTVSGSWSCVKANGCEAQRTRCPAAVGPTQIQSVESVLAMGTGDAGIDRPMALAYSEANSVLSGYCSFSSPAISAQAHPDFHDEPQGQG
jgi:hypothetical protein